MTNLSVFAGDYEGQSIRVNEDGQFSVFDVLTAFIKPSERNGSVGVSINPRQVYKSITERNPEVVQFCDNFKFPGRGQRETPVATEEGIYQILMLCPGKRGAEFRQWAAKLVRERREEESNPELAYTRGRQRAISTWKKRGFSDEDIAERLKGIEARHHFTDTLKAHGVTEPRQYAAITNEIYLALYDATASELKEQRGLSKRDSLRDSCSRVENAAHFLAEVMASEDIKVNNLQGFTPCKDATRKAGEKVRRVFD